MSIKLKNFPYLLTTFKLLLFAPFVLTEEFAIHYVTASEEIFSEPHDIVLSPDGQQLYVADNGNDRIVVLNAQTLKQISVFAKGEVSQPHDVAFDEMGRLLVADTGNSRIAIYEKAGDNWQLAGELRERIRRPEGVAVHADGRVFATGSSSNNLVVYKNGQVVAERGGFSSPHDVGFDRTGKTWVADANNDRMVELNDRLEITRILSGPPYNFRGPRYQCLDEANRLYVADKYSNSIKVIAPNGELLQVIGGEKSGKGPNLFNRPEGVEIRGKDVWFSDTYNDRIVRYMLD
jgi:YVTN family beta-propeller protein